MHSVSMMVVNAHERMSGWSGFSSLDRSAPQHKCSTPRAMAGGSSSAARSAFMRTALGDCGASLSAPGGSFVSSPAPALRARARAATPPIAPTLRAAFVRLRFRFTLFGFFSGTGGRGSSVSSFSKLMNAPPRASRSFTKPKR